MLNTKFTPKKQLLCAAFLISTLSTIFFLNTSTKTYRTEVSPINKPLKLYTHDKFVTKQPEFKLGKPFEPNSVYHVEISDSSENVLPPGFDNHSYEIDKSKKYDVCTIGAGISGTVFAERTAKYLSQKVLVIDSRPHIGGNCFDYIDQKTGILRNQYGSHLFHTKMEHVWNYVTSNPNAPKWKRWYHAKFGFVDGDYVPIPVNIQTVNRLLDTDIKTSEDMDEWLASVQIPCPKTGCENAEQMAKSRVGEKLYKLIFEGYTIKQWGRDPKELSASVTARIPVVSSWDPRYFSDKWQSLPSKGYTAWFAAMLDHPMIDVVLNTDFFDHRSHLEEACGKIIYTGPIDRYFEQTGMEKLEYRSIIFTEERHMNHPGYILPTPVLNYPGLETQYTRAVEYKHYLHRASNHTIVVKEVSSADGDPYYPVPTKRNQELYSKYQALASEVEESGTIQFVGRLANYKYYNMDQAIDNALNLFYESVPNRAVQFMATEFKAYKVAIETAMASFKGKHLGMKSKDCKIPKWKGEFGMELRAITPWAYYMKEKCGFIETSGLKGTKYLYFFSNKHTIRHDSANRFSGNLPEGHPFNVKTPHFSDEQFPIGIAWHPPPYAEFFHRSEFDSLIGKELVVILNKYTREWKEEPKNYFSVETLTEMLDYLTPKYTVLYKRDTPKVFTDNSGMEKDLGEKDMIRKNYGKKVLFFEDFSNELDDVEDYNLLLFGMLSMSKKFLTVQGGTAVTGSYFGGNNIILIKKGVEIETGDYTYFHRFSNATVTYRRSDRSFLDEMKKTM